MNTPTEELMAGLRTLVAEEMHLLGQELEDSLDAGQHERLLDICSALDEAVELLTKHRAVRRV